MEEKISEELLDEMDTFLSQNTVSSCADDGDLPFEPLDAFSTDPVEFSEMAERMLVKVENLFDLTRLYNRHSAKYLKAFGMLERGIRQLGSVCVTRTAMKDHNHPLPELGQLTTQKLYRMASFNYRKLDTALTEKLEQGNDLYPELTDAFMRCFTLLRRLRATERKIYTWFINKYDSREDYNPTVEGLAFSARSCTKSYYPKNEEAPAFRDAPAYPVLKEAVCNPVLKSEAKKKPAKAAEAGNKTNGVTPAEKPEDPAANEETKPAVPAEETEEIKKETEKPEHSSESKSGEQRSAEKTEERENSSEPGSGEQSFAEEAETAKPPEEEKPKSSAKKAPEITKPVNGTPLSLEAPPCLEIVHRAMSRGYVSEEGGIGFTDEEISALAKDPCLDIIFPELAAWIKSEVRSECTPSGTDFD